MCYDIDEANSKFFAEFIDFEFLKSVVKDDQGILILRQICGMSIGVQMFKDDEKINWLYQLLKEMLESDSENRRTQVLHILSNMYSRGFDKEKII